MTIHEPKPLKISGTMGWECPKCNRVYSPIVVECPHCGIGKTESKIEETRKLLLENISD